MTDGPGPRFRWWREHELKINLALTAVFLMVFVAAVLLGKGIVAGLSLLLTIFFATYSIYGYIRR